MTRVPTIGFNSNFFMNYCKRSIENVLNSIMIHAQTFITFVTIAFRRVSKGIRAAMHFDDLGTFDTRKVHLSSIPPLTVRARDLSAASIANVAGPRRSSSPSETKDPPSSREAMPGTWPSEWTLSRLSLSRRIESMPSDFASSSVFLSRVHRVEIRTVCERGYLPVRRAARRRANTRYTATLGR